MINVAIVSPEHSLEPVDKVISEHDFGCQFHKYIYSHMEDIDAIYQDCQDKCSVIFFSGELGYHYIRSKFPEIKIPCAFTAYEPIDVLSILLNFQINHPSIPLNRVFCDFLTTTNHFMDVTKYLPEEKCPVFFTDTHYDYEHITGFAKRLRDEGRIDMILSRSINNLNKLDELKIPYEAVFPSEEMIIASIQTALNEIRLKSLNPTNELSLLIRLPFAEETDQEEQEYREASVYKLLTDYRRKRKTHFTITQGFNQFEIHKKIDARIQNADFLRPALLDFKRQISFPFRIGCGIGGTLEKSRAYAEHALLEANRYGRNDAFFYGESGIVTGPLSTDKALVYSYSNEKAQKFAEANGINETNILKLISLFDRDRTRILSSLYLSEQLGITARSASRILEKLLELHLVHLTDADPALHHPRQGRPTHYFMFNFEEFRNQLLES